MKTSLMKKSSSGSGLEPSHKENNGCLITSLFFQKDVPNWVLKTAVDIEEERAIKEICYKSGEYYRIQPSHKHQSTKTVSSLQEKELLPLEATDRDLQKGDGNTTPTTFNNAKREGERSGRKVATENIPRTDRRAFENAEIHTSNPTVKPSYQQRGQRKGDETDSSRLCVTQTGIKSSFSSPEPRRKAYVVYRSVTANQEPKGSEATDFKQRNIPFVGVKDVHGGIASLGRSCEPPGNAARLPMSFKRLERESVLSTSWYSEGMCDSPDDKCMSGYSNAPTWRRRNPHAKTFSQFKTTSQMVLLKGHQTSPVVPGMSSNTSLEPPFSSERFIPALQSQSLSAVLCNGFKSREKGAATTLKRDKRYFYSV
ncbi:uncharacterized protein C12orf50 homolog [Strix aluco]|uniref:uncharacterized protein C12orf50 homolog n=1 Tax=Strix aluco TaxID=111821 RepID=UPI003DA63B8C